MQRQTVFLAAFFPLKNAVDTHWGILLPPMLTAKPFALIPLWPSEKRAAFCINPHF